MTERQIDVFFYGLFMDTEILRASGIEPERPRAAYVDHFELCIGQRATLVPDEGSRAYGMVFALTHSDLRKLYAAPGLDQYRAEAVMAQSLDGAPVPALCYNLHGAPGAEDRNLDYAARLQATLERLGFPGEYVASVNKRSA